MSKNSHDLEEVATIEVPAVTCYEQLIAARVQHFYLSDEIGEPILYIDMIHKMRTAQPGDVVVIHINCVGGDLSTGVQIINAMKASQAHIVCSVEGVAYSLGTLIFLSGDEFVVGDHSIFMFHNFSGAVMGKGHEQRSQLNATIEWFERMGREIYIPFMSEEEFTQMIAGSDLWMLDTDVRERLVALVELEAAEAAEDEEETS